LLFALSPLALEYLSPAFAANDLARNDLPCHPIDERLVDPAYKDVDANDEGRLCAVTVAQLRGAVPTPATNVRADEQTLRRGKYLVDSVLSCGNCHSPRTSDDSVIPGRELSGGRTYDTPVFYVTPGNLTEVARFI